MSLSSPVSGRPAAANYHLQIDLNDRRYWVIAVELALDSAFIQTDAPLSAGQNFTISVNQAAGGVASRARVVSVSERGFEVEFLDPSEAFLDRLGVWLGGGRRPAAAAA